MNPLASIKQPINQEFELFDKHFTHMLRSDNPLLSNIMDYLQEKRGKQIRPILILLSAKLCGKITDKTINTAIALELLHTASLVHDDVVDSTLQRRGRASVNAQWDNKVAILTGDYMLSQSLETAAGLHNQRILQIIANIGKALSSGELLQLLGSQNIWITEKEYFTIIHQKTAQLFAACTESGAISAGASHTKVQHIRLFGEQLGICFQLKDDLFDFSENKELGKPTMNDVRDGKITLPLIKALENASEKERNHIHSIINHHDFAEEHLSEIKQFVQQFGGIDYSIRMMEKQKTQAMETLYFFPDNEAKLALLELLNYTISREI